MPARLDAAQRPGGERRTEADLHQIFRLVHLHRVPDEQRAEITEGDPPEAAGAQRTAERPVHRDPGRIDDIGVRPTAASVGEAGSPSGARPMSSGRRRTRRLSGSSRTSTTMPSARHAVRQPARDDQALQPRQQDDGANADAGERQAHRQTASADEPIGQEQPLAGIAQADAAAAHQQAERRIELPRLLHQRRQQQSGADQHHAQLVHDQRATPIHQPAKRWAHDRRDDEAERECAGRRAAIPAELVEDRREQQRERGARIHRHAHGDEDDGDDHPAIEERQTRSGVARTSSAFRRASRAWRSPYFIPSSLSPSGSRKNTA